MLIPIERVFLHPLHLAVAFIVTVDINHTVPFLHLARRERDDVDDAPRRVADQVDAVI